MFEGNDLASVNGLVEDIVVGLVVDGDIGVVLIWCVPPDFIDFTIQWVAEWQRVDPASSRSDTSRDNMVVACVLWHSRFMEWRNVHENGEYLTSLLSLWQDEAVGESRVGFSVFQWEISLLGPCSQNPFVQFVVGGAILNGESEFG